MYQSIVVGTDGSKTAQQAVRQAAELAAATGAQVHVVSAYTPVSKAQLDAERKGAPDDVQHQFNPQEEVDGHLDDAEDIASKAKVSVRRHAKKGDPVDAILDLAEEEGADLIVVGNKGMAGAKRFLLGSVPDKISHHAPCSVMIVHTS